MADHSKTKLYSAGFKNTLEHDEKEILLMHPIDLMKQIDWAEETLQSYCDSMKAKFNKGKRKKYNVSLAKWRSMWDDIGLEYDQWSHIFNKNVRKLMKNPIDKELGTKYKYVYGYWWNRFWYIEKFMKKKSGFGGTKLKKNLAKGKDTLTKLILGEIDYKVLSPEFRKLIDQLGNMEHDRNK